MVEVVGAVGQAKITKGYNLPAKYVIHTVGPIWRGGQNNEAQLLADCYVHSLDIVKEQNINSVAFPLISAGAYGYPKEEALQIAITTICNYLRKIDITVCLVLFNETLHELAKRVYLALDIENES